MKKDNLKLHNVPFLLLFCFFTILSIISIFCYVFKALLLSLTLHVTHNKFLSYTFIRSTKNDFLNFLLFNLVKYTLKLIFCLWHKLGNTVLLWSSKGEYNIPRQKEFCLGISWMLSNYELPIHKSTWLWLLSISNQHHENTYTFSKPLEMYLFHHLVFTYSSIL